MDNVAATFAMGVNDPAPAISGDGRCNNPTKSWAALSLSAMISQYSISGMMPEPANRVQSIDKLRIGPLATAR